jgi:hypothetical protein
VFGIGYVMIVEISLIEKEKNQNFVINVGLKEERNGERKN